MKEIMKKLFLIVGVSMATVFFLGQSASADLTTFSKVIEVPGANEKQLLDKVGVWAERYATSHYVDAKSGLVTANGEMTYPSPPIDRIQYTIKFEIRNSIEGNRNTVTFEKVMLKSPETYFSSDTGGGPSTIPSKLEPVQSREDIAAANWVMTHVAASIESFLLKKSDSACPLVKCSECSVLCPSAEEMKEHMKRHEHMKGHSGDESEPAK
jgi:hypothetical protein